MAAVCRTSAIGAVHFGDRPSNVNTVLEVVGALKPDNSIPARMKRLSDDALDINRIGPW